MMAQRVRLGGRWRWVVKATLRSLYLRDRTPVPLVEEAGWNPGQVWTQVEKKKFLAFTGFEPRSVQPVARRYTA